MPDHVHLLLDSEHDDGDVRKVMIDFKQQTGYWLSKNTPTIKWQKDFYDHVLRKNEDLEKQVGYILENPLRKGMVKDWKDYPYKGSTIYDLNEWD
jgi:REP element-mobilizing transposase RayT